MIQDDMLQKLSQFEKASFKRIKTTVLPTYEKSSTPLRKGKCVSRFVEVHQNGHTDFIHKTTAVWLFQEGERVSSDHLFHVRAKQPYSCISKPEQGTLADSSVTIPTVCQAVMVGDMCMHIYVA